MTHIQAVYKDQSYADSTHQAMLAIAAARIGMSLGYAAAGRKYAEKRGCNPKLVRIAAQLEAIHRINF